MKGRASVWLRVRRLEVLSPERAWTGPLPLVSPQRWSTADAAAWEAAWTVGNGATLDALIERNTCISPLLEQAEIGWIEIHHLPSRDAPCVG